LRIVVLKGGRSSEREVSLRTGSAVAQGLRELGHEVAELDPKEEGFIEKLTGYNPDLVFIALHGPYGEDGRIQGMLDMLGIRYVGSGVLGSALAMDKEFTKKILRYEGIPTPDWICVRKGSRYYWDNTSKYTEGETEYLFLEDEILANRLREIALKVHRVLDLKDFSRVDFRVDDEGNPYVLEVNTIPGMTELSLFPMACKKEGIDFTEMLSMLTETRMGRARRSGKSSQH